jgi:fructokinase
MGEPDMFLVCGEALFDVFVAADGADSLRLDARPGGSPFNVAVGLARLGQPVWFLGGVSTDMLGERLVRALVREGVRTEAIERFDAPTTLGLVGVGDDGVPRYAFYGEGASDRRLLAERPPVIDGAVKAIHVGSYATVVEPVASALEALVRRERRSRFIAYDPNVRLNVEPSCERWRAAVDVLSGLAHLVKISDEDVRLLFGDASADSLASRWLGRGAGIVVMTRGPRGAIAWSRDAKVEVPGAAVAVVDTVGAGDTFQSAMLARLAETGGFDAARAGALAGRALRAIVAFAVRAAAITCGRRGADMPRRAELGAA